MLQREHVGKEKTQPKPSEELTSAIGDIFEQMYIETLELLAAPKALECFRRGITDLKSGRVKVLTVRD